MYDYLAVYDGMTNNSRKIEQICGLQFPDDVTSSGNYLLLRFKSDQDVAGSGFNLTYFTHQALRNILLSVLKKLRYNFIFSHKHSFQFSRRINYILICMSNVSQGRLNFKYTSVFSQALFL